MIETFKKILEENQLISGGFLILCSGSVLGILYKSYGYILGFFTKYFFLGMDFSSEDPAFENIKHWLYNIKYTKEKCTKYKIINKSLHIPAYGFHYFFNKGRLHLVNFGSEKDKTHRIENINMSILCFSNKQKLKKNIIQESIDLIEKEKYLGTKVFMPDGSYWTPLKRKRIKKSIPILDNETIYNNIKQDIEIFYNSEKWYNENSIQYKRGYLFYGPAGGGKTSSIISLAQNFQKHLCLVNLGEMRITDYSFIKLVGSLPKNSLLVMEDVDAISKPTSKRKNIPEELDSRGITLSTVLNTLDGIFSPEGLVFFMTTNYINKLDDALIRPGRIDFIHHFNNANEYQVRTIFKKFFNNTLKEDIFVKSSIGRSMASLENHLMTHKNDINKAIILPKLIKHRSKNEKTTTTKKSTIKVF